MIEFTYLNKEL